QMQLRKKEKSAAAIWMSFWKGLTDEGFLRTGNQLPQNLDHRSLQPEMQILHAGRDSAGPDA
ncbi:MAG: hypothetical protein ACI4WR_09105, partial [Bulleidia sp.]